MICRIWRGWTTHSNADAFERAVASIHYPTLLGGHVPGFRGTQLLRLTRPGGVEFINIMWFDSIDAISKLADGKEDEPLFLPPASRALLRRFETRVEHFDVRAVKDPL